MELIIQALQQAGYTIEKQEPWGKDVALTVAKDGWKRRFAVSPTIGTEGVAEMMRWVEYTYQRKLLPKEV